MNAGQVIRQKTGLDSKVNSFATDCLWVAVSWSGLSSKSLGRKWVQLMFVYTANATSLDACFQCWSGRLHKIVSTVTKLTRPPKQIVGQSSSHGVAQPNN